VNDLEQQLRELLETRSHDASIGMKPSVRVMKRARRRQFGTALTAIVGVVAVTVASIIGVQAVVRTDAVRPRPAVEPILPDAPDAFRSAVLPFGSIVYPKGWSLLAFDEGAKVLQLTNFDPEFATPCVSRGEQELPPLGAILVVERVGEADASLPMWPVALFQPATDGDWDCGGAQEEAFGEPALYEVSWRLGSTSFIARAALGPLAPTEVRQLLSDTFASLTFVDGDQPQTEELLGASNLVLDARETPVGPVTLYAYVDDFEGGSAWVGIAGVAGTGLGGAGQIGRVTPSVDENVTMNLEEWGGVVWGEVPSSVAHAELRTVEGGTFPARLLPLPPLPWPLGVDVQPQQIVWGVVEGRTADRVTTLLYDADGKVLNTYYPTEPRTVIASGSDPDGGPWELYLEHTDQGTGLGFAFEMGGGGSGCCLRPLESDFRLDGSGSGGGEPSNITALGSEALERVVFEAASGERIEGQVFPIPDGSLGIARVALVLVPSEIELDGDVVGYDASGNELGRGSVGPIGEPPGPTPEIDAVWQSLRRARNAASRYLEREGTFAGLSAQVLAEMAHGITTATSPEPETVSAYVTDELHLVVSSSAITGESFCIAVEADGPHGGFNYRYGSVFAETYDECRGGWLPE
jgi:hypothetical protein